MFFLSLFLSEPWFGRTTKETSGSVSWLALLEFSHFKENDSLSFKTGIEGKQPATWLKVGMAVWDRAGDGCPCRPAQTQAGRQMPQQLPAPRILKTNTSPTETLLGWSWLGGGYRGDLAHTLLIQRIFKTQICLKSLTLPSHKHRFTPKRLTLLFHYPPPPLSFKTINISTPIILSCSSCSHTVTLIRSSRVSKHDVEIWETAWSHHSLIL